MVEWGEVLWAAQTQAFRLDTIVCVFAAMGLSSVLILASKKFCHLEFVLPAVLLVSFAVFDGRQRNLRPLHERFRNFELPGKSLNEIDVFFQKAKQHIAPNAVVLATGDASIQGRVRLLWNTPLFFGYKNSPQNRSIWKEYYERGHLQQKFEANPSLEIIQNMNVYQQIRYVVSEQQILKWTPLFQYGMYRLYDLEKI